MEIVLWYLTPESGGGSDLFGPVGDRLKLELNPAGYGAAIKSLWVSIALPETLGELTPDEELQFGVRPRKRFTRKSGKFSIDCLSEHCTSANEASPRLKDHNAAAKDVLSAILLIESSLKPTDDFDMEAFERDVRRILGRDFKSRKEIEGAQEKLWSENIEESDRQLREELKNPNPTHALETYEIMWPMLRPEPENFSFLEFRDETSCISQWYFELVGKRLKGVTPRLYVDFDDRIESPEMRAMARLACPFDFASYFELPDADRKAMVAGTLCEGLTFFAGQMHENSDPVAEAFATMKAAGFRFQGKLKKRFQGGRLTAQVEFEYGTKGMEIVAAFFKKGGRRVIERKSMGVCPPHPWLLNILPNGCGWKGSKFQINLAFFESRVETKSIK